MTRTTDAEASRPDEAETTPFDAALVAAEAEIADANGALAEARGKMTRLREQANSYREELARTETERDQRQAEFTRAFQVAMHAGMPPPSDADVEAAEGRVRQLRRHVDAADAAVTAFDAVGNAESRVRSTERAKARLELAEEERLLAEAQVKAEALRSSIAKHTSRISLLREAANRY